MGIRLSGRGDGLLLAGLAVALFTVFDRTIGWLLEIANQVEVSYGMRLLPALIVLAVILLVHLNVKRQESRAAAAAAALTARIAEERLRELERLHSLGRQLAGAVSMETVQGALWRHLPAMAEDRDSWVAVWSRDRAEILVDSTGQASERIEEVTRRLIDAWHDHDEADIVRREDGDCCFLLVAGGEAIGVVSISERQLPISPKTERMIAAASALVAVSIRNVHLFVQLRENAVTDSLTGCANRAHFLEQMSNELRRGRRTGAPISLLMIDLDGFKHINDQGGHLAGDSALAAIGQRMRELLRKSDVRCRYGGDEFLVLLPDTPVKGAMHVAEVLRREIEALAIGPADSTTHVTASIGVAPAISGEIDPVFCIERADRALYEAKRIGRNAVRVFELDPASEEPPPRLARSA